MDRYLSDLADNAPLLWSGLKLTLTMTGFAGMLGLFLGTAFAVLRTSGPAPLRTALTGLVNLLRCLPLLLVLFWSFFLLPLAIGHAVDGFWSALVALSVFEAAYVSEIVRAGLLGVPSGQTEAARALGLRSLAAYRLVLLPQALRIVLPILATQAIILFQDTSLLYIVSLHDFTTVSSLIARRDGTLVESYGTAAAVYLFVCLVASAAIRRLHARLQTSARPA